ncbi:MAG: hypothetical protein M0P20_01695 [Methanocorpusculum sp.]|jgi:hypothetical protein|nr:hypothetical protein [Methanocorpusculum sp.]
MSRRINAVFVLLLAAVLFCGAGQAALTENLNLTYDLGDYYTDIMSVNVTNDGGYYLGVLHDGNLSLLKTDANGKELWSTNVTGTEFRSIVTLSDGGCLYVTALGTDTYLCRSDASGKISYELPLIGIGAGISPVVVSGEKIKFAGWFWETDTGFTQSFLLSNGTPADDQLSLPDGRIPVSMIRDSDGSYVLVGGTTSDINQTSTEAWIMKIKDGNVPAWTSVLKTNALQTEYYGNGSTAYVVCAADDGGYFVAGTTSAYNLTYSYGIIWGAMVSADGKVSWEKEFRGAVPYGVARIGTDYLIAGIGWGAPLWLTVTSGGALVDVVYPNASGQFSSAVQTSSGSVVLAGWSSLTGSPDGYLIGISDGSTTTSPAPVAGLIIGLAGAALVAFGGAKRRQK